VEDGYVNAGFYYETSITETKTETFLVDFGVLVSAVGGSLGLFLGFSCYAALISLLEMARKILF